MTDSIVTRSNIQRLSHEQIDRLVKLHLANDYRKMVPLDEKCRTYCYNKVPGWGHRLLDVENGLLSAVRKGGLYDTQKLMAGLACLQEAVLAEMAREGRDEKDKPIITDAEFVMMTRAAHQILSEIAEPSVEAPETPSTLETGLDAVLDADDLLAPGGPSESVTGLDDLFDEEEMPATEPEGPRPWSEIAPGYWEGGNTDPEELKQAGIVEEPEPLALGAVYTGDNVADMVKDAREQLGLDISAEVAALAEDEDDWLLDA